MAMASTVISRHFATLAGLRQVHYRRAGSGSAVLVLHQSPASSAELIPLIHELASHYTVIAPDTPGNGLSTPLPIAHPDMDAFAAALIELLDVLGIARVAVYGFHSGAACAMALAHRYPERVALAVANGYTQMQPAELADILQHYLPPLRIEADGTHLAWAWSRIRDQYLYFPWYAHQPSARLPTGMPRTRQLHESVMDLLRAGDAYPQAYRAAFNYDRAAVVGELKVPTVIMTARTDALYPYLDLMPEPSTSVSVHRPADYAEARQVLRKSLSRYDGPPVPAAAATRPLSRGLWCYFLQTASGSLFALRSSDGPGRPLVCCHGSNGSALGLKEMMTPLAGRRPVLAIDLPGNGESLRPEGESTSVSVEAQAGQLAEAVAAAGYTDVDLLAVGWGATVAAEFARRQPHRVGQLTLVGLQEAQTIGPPIELDDHGLHLLRVWNIMRDQMLYSPWNQRKRANVLTPPEAALSPQVIHQRTLDTLKCLDALPQIEAAHAGYPLTATLTELQEANLSINFQASP